MIGKASKTRVLYKTILKLHRGLPAELKKMGDSYVRDEFKRHKTAEAQFIPQFYKEWTKYANTLAKQLGGTVTNEKLGLGLTEDHISKLSEVQVGQLFELYQETQRYPDAASETPDAAEVPDQSNKPV